MTTWAQRACRKKVDYLDRRKAKKKAAKLRKQVKVKPYRCPICVGWHLTKGLTYRKGM